MYFIFIYYKRTYSRHSGVGTHQCQERRKEGMNKGVKRWKKKKRIKAQRENSRISILPVLELIGDAEQTGRKEKREQRKKQKAGLQLPWALRSHPTTRRDHTVSQFFLGIF